MEKESFHLQIAKCSRNILRGIADWEQMKANDRLPLNNEKQNQLRNQVKKNKETIISLCSDNKIDLPAEYYFPTPPKATQVN